MKKIIVIMIGMIGFGLCLTACGTKSPQMYNRLRAPSSDGMGGLGKYLINYEDDSAYICADITLIGFLSDESGESYSYSRAEIEWQTFDSPESMDEELYKLRQSAKEQPTDGEIRLVYYKCRMPEEVHALELYHTLMERYDTEDTPLWVWSREKGTNYTFCQKIQDKDEYYHSFSPKSAINIIVKDRVVYGLSVINLPIDADYEALRLFIIKELISIFDKDEHSYFGWTMDEENFYWLDHEERITEMEEPARSFKEIRGIDDYLRNGGFMQYFGMLQEADYELPASNDGQILSIHFSFADDIPETGYKTDLIQGFCADEGYNMTVTDKESGKVLQEEVVNLCIELPDTITFKDFNDDGYLDMFIDKPLHSNYTRAVADEQSWHYIPVYMLWNSQTEQFERSYRLPDNQNSLTQDEWEENTEQKKQGTEDCIEYVVQPGDTLWDISERFLGTGVYWTELQREENALKAPDYLLPGEIIYIPGITAANE